MGFGESFGDDSYEVKSSTKKESGSGLQKKVNASESKETYGPLKVFEVNKPLDVGFGTKSTHTVKSAEYMKNHPNEPKEMLSYAMNGPLCGEQGNPIGGYIDNGKKYGGVTYNGNSENNTNQSGGDWVDPKTVRISPYRPEDAGKGNFSTRNGIFGVGTDGIPHLIPYENIKSNSTSFKRAFQNGPMLLQGGKNLCNSSSTSAINRSGIGFTSTGKVIAIYSDTPTTPYEFAQQFSNRGCTDAIFLDGGPYAGYEDETGQHGSLNANAKKLQFFQQK